MDSFVKMLVAAIIVGSLIVVAAYLKFGRGLATRIFGTVIPLTGFSALLGHFIGIQGTTLRAILIGAVSAIAVVVPVLLWMHRSVVSRLETQVHRLSTSAAQIAATAKQSAATAAEQAATVAQITATIEELLQTSAATAATAQRVASAASEASGRGAEGLDASKRAQAVLETVAQISDIVDSVRDFADQSNLLAVNAGIEAAKAGDHGRGFGVVASEVRNLAEQSKRAAQRISAAVAGTEDGRRAVEAAIAVLARLAATLDENTDSAQQIAATASEEAAAVRQIAESMTNVAEGGHANAEAARQLEAAVGTMRGVTDDLGRLVSG